MSQINIHRLSDRCKKVIVSDENLSINFSIAYDIELQYILSNLLTFIAINRHWKELEELRRTKEIEYVEHTKNTDDFVTKVS